VQPFTIQCTTCRRSLRVASPAAIGQILSCPKCSGMILIEAPDGWDTTPSASDPTISSMGMAVAVATPNSSASSAGIAPSSLPAIVTAPIASVPVAPVPPVINAAPPPSVADVAPANTATAWKNPPADFLPGGERSSSQVAAANAPSIDSPTPIENAWPRWFWPGVGSAIALGVVILVVRLMLHRGPTPLENAPEIVAADKAAANQQSATDPPLAAVTNKPVVDERAQPISNESNLTTKIDQPAAGDAAEVANTAAPAVVSPSASAEIAAAPPTNNPPSSVPPPLPAPPAASGNGNSNFAMALQPALPLESIIPDMSAANSTNTTPAQAPAVVANQPADRPAPRSLQRVAPRLRNVKARLAETIPGLTVKNISLADFLSLISELSTIPIAVDADALLEMGRTSNVAVQLNSETSSYAELIEAAIEPLKLSTQASAGQLIVGYPQEQNLRTANYTVTDLVGNDPEALTELAALVQELVAPQTWKPAGGTGALSLASGAFKAEQTDSVHNQLIVFCEKLRIARGLPQKSKFDPSRFLLATRTEKAQALLNRPVTINFGAPDQLAVVAKWLQQATGATILIDHAALAQDETSDQSECTVVAVKKPFAAVLDDLLNPAELTWRAIDDRTIEITTRRAAASRFEIEFHPTREVAANAGGAEMLAAQIKSQIEPTLWTSQSTQAVIHFDAPSRTFIVRAPQKVQVQIERFLAAPRQSQ
jgi:hypothetical protein